MSSGGSRLHGPQSGVEAFVLTAEGLCVACFRWFRSGFLIVDRARERWMPVCQW